MRPVNPRSLSLSRAFAALLSALALLVSASPARADLTADLSALDAQAVALRARLSAVTLTGSAVCSPLGEANGLARDLAREVVRVDESLSAPLAADAATLDALERLSQTSADLGLEALRLSTDLSALSDAAEPLSLAAGITAMLQLSADIGVMADRIGEMADKILVMSDDIGAMADRILVTQTVQSQSYALTLDAILETQANVLAVVSVVEDGAHGLRLQTLLTRGAVLGARMSATMLSPWAMKAQLAAVATDVRGMLGEVSAASAAVSLDAASSTFTTSTAVLGQLADLSVMLTALGTAVDGYVIALGGLGAITSAPTLSASLKSILALSADIGVMANRVLEMADVILAMSTNIGVEADRIVASQQLMSLNVAATQASILGAQRMAVQLIVARSL